MRIWVPPVLLTALLCALSAGMPALEPLFEWVQPDKQNVIYERESFLFLLQNHLTLVVISALVGTVAAVAGGIFATRPSGAVHSVETSGSMGLPQPSPSPSTYHVNSVPSGASSTSPEQSSSMPLQISGASG